MPSMRRKLACRAATQAASGRDQAGDDDKAAADREEMQPAIRSESVPAVGGHVLRRCDDVGSHPTIFKGGRRH